MRHVDLCERVERSPSALRTWRGEVELAEHDVLEHSAMGEKMEGLEHEADATAPQRGSLRVTQLDGVDAIEEVLAATVAIQTPEHVEQRRLP